jgi:hypothetical protein
MRHQALLINLLAPLALWTVLGPPAAAAEDSVNLAKKLANPVADLISVPFQGNSNRGIGPDGDGSQTYVNFQPVLPIHLNKDWNIIARTVAPLMFQNDGFTGSSRQFGLGNIEQSFFLSPSLPKNGFLWGVGPIVYLPASDDLLGPREWGAGLTGAAVWQGGPWTAGLLAHQLWPLADTSANSTINQSYLQPFLAYTTKNAWTFTLNTESTYQWLDGEWSVPLNLQVSKLVKMGQLPVSLFAGARYWVSSPDREGPTGWGARFGLTLLFPAGRP